MTFTKKLSTKQETAIVLLIVGLFLFLNRKAESSGTLLAIFGMILIIGSINNFFYDFIRKRKIVKRYQKNFYDSKGEKQIADYLKRKNVSFEHHPTIKVEKYKWGLTIPFRKIKIEPDFYLPEFDVYVEYWGLINDQKYKENQYKRKKKLYKDNDLDLLSLYPKNLKNLDFTFTSKLLEIFKERQGFKRKYR